MHPIEIKFQSGSLHSLGLGDAHLDLDLFISGFQLLYFLVLMFKTYLLYAFHCLLQVFQTLGEFAHVISQLAHLIKLGEKLDVNKVFFLDFVPLGEILEDLIEENISLVKIFLLALVIFRQQALINRAEIDSLQSSVKGWVFQVELLFHC